MIPFSVLRSKRLALRQLEIQDANQILELRSNEEVNKYLDRPKAETLEDATDFINKINYGIEANKSFYWGLTYKEGGSLIGTICIYNNEKKMAEIGYELLPAHQGKGLMQEALETVLHFAFNELKLEVIIAVFHPDNHASVRLLERNKFILNTDVDDLVENMVVYKLNKKN
ncbi:MAG: GNAT family N-acetyltransferase [Flavisolibacter sp.]